MSRSRSDRLALVGAVLVGALTLGGCGGSSDPATTSASEEQWPIELPSTATPATTDLDADDQGSTTTGSTATDPMADLEVEDQSGNGREVVIESVITSREPALLVITTLNGDVLGVEPVSTGSQPVSVKLQQPVTTSQELLASLHLDKNGNSFFDPAKDTLLVDDVGEPVREDFDYVVH